VVARFNYAQLNYMITYFFLEKTIPIWNPRLNSASPETVKEGHLRKGWWPPGDTPTTRWSGNGEWPLYRWISHYKMDGYWDSFIGGFTTLYRSDVNPVDIICRSLFCVSLGDQSDAIRTSGFKQSCSLKISWILGKQGCPIVQYSKILFQSFLLEFHVGVHELSCISLCERHLLWQSPQSPRPGAVNPHSRHCKWIGWFPCRDLGPSRFVGFRHWKIWKLGINDPRAVTSYLFVAFHCDSRNHVALGCWNWAF
jgi:hypothetical protein